MLPSSPMWPNVPSTSFSARLAHVNDWQHSQNGTLLHLQRRPRYRDIRTSTLHVPRGCRRFLCHRNRWSLSNFIRTPALPMILPRANHARVLSSASLARTHVYLLLGYVKSTRYRRPWRRSMRLLTLKVCYACKVCPALMRQC